MPRPKKVSLSYFPFDSDFFDSTRVKLLLAAYGFMGVGIYIYLLCKIYKEEGYYYEIDEERKGIICYELHMEEDKFQTIIEYCISHNIFDKKLWDNKRILTSAYIQDVYQKAKKRAGLNAPVEVDREIWLLEDNKTNSIILLKDIFNDGENSFLTENPGYLEENSGFLTDYPQSKVKESKINKSILKESKVMERFKNAFPDLTLKEEAIIMMYLDDGVPDTLFDYAISEAQRFNKSCAYALKIVKDCVEKNRVEVKKTVKSSGSSYDLEAFEKSAWDVPEIV